MPVLKGVQISTTRAQPHADAIIARMRALLIQRKHHGVGRRAFLQRWSGLRNAMRLTPEYQRMIEVVRLRAKGFCEVCGLNAGAHMHHLVPVAFAPKLILDARNLMWVCTGCHPKEDKKSRRLALGEWQHRLMNRELAEDPNDWRTWRLDELWREAVAERTELDQSTRRDASRMELTEDGDARAERSEAAGSRGYPMTEYSNG